jgi:hypothetical protein
MYHSTLEEIVQELSKARPKKKSMFIRTLDVKFDKGIVINKSREMDVAFQAYVVSTLVLKDLLHLNVRRYRCKILLPISSRKLRAN